jgi:antitoxin VapB
MFRAMPITIRNRALEEKIRAIGNRTSEGPSAVIARAISNEEERLKAGDEALKAERVAAMKRLRQQAREMLTDDDRAAIRREMDDLYDEDGLPK